jgi:hypothetical protein
MWLADVLAILSQDLKKILFSVWGTVHPHTVWKRGKHLIAGKAKSHVLYGISLLIVPLS